MNQIALPLDWPAEESSDAFIVSASNSLAVRRLHAFGTWPVSTMILTGPRKSGRSLFGRLFVCRCGARLIDDAESRDEVEIFHAWNEAQSQRRPLLVVANAPPPIWEIKLPDLRSRLSATPVVSFGDPDEPMIGQLLSHLLERRGIAVSAEVLAFLLPRIERTHHAIISVVDKLDEAALSRRRPITVPLARDVLAVDGAVAVA